MMKTSDIVNKEFSRSFMGYDMREVDCFLDEIIEQLETYERERQEMLTAMEYLLRELEQFDDIADDAEKQLRHPETPQAAAVPSENRTRRTVRVNPAAAPADPDEETAPMAESGAEEPTLVLEELEIDEEPAWTAESDDAAVDAPAEPEAKSQEPQPNQAPAAPAGEANADQAPAAPAGEANADQPPAAPAGEVSADEAPAAPDGEASADETPAAPEQPQAADDPTGKETN